MMEVVLPSQCEWSQRKPTYLTHCNNPVRYILEAVSAEHKDKPAIIYICRMCVPELKKRGYTIFADLETNRYVRL